MACYYQTLISQLSSEKEELQKDRGRLLALRVKFSGNPEKSERVAALLKEVDDMDLMIQNSIDNLQKEVDHLDAVV